jgi:hypothetical protein
MSVIPIATAKEHARIVGNVEDATVQLYLDAAEQAAASYMHRFFFVDQAALTAAIAAAPGALEAARADLQTREDAALALTDCVERELALEAVAKGRTDVATAYLMAMLGIVITDAIKAACLLTFGHLYLNRENNIVAPGVTVAVELPFGANALLQPYRIGLGV